MHEKVIRAQRFEIVDDAGQTRVIIGIAKDENPAWAFYDANGIKRAKLTLVKDGEIELELCDEGGTPQAKVAFQPEGLALEKYRAGRETTRAKLGPIRDGGFTFSIHDEQGNPRTLIGISEDGTSYQALHDAKGRPRAVLALNEQGNPGVAMFDKKDGIVWKAP